MKHEKPIHKHTPEEFSALVDECIAKIKDPNDEYEACPEQLYNHVKLSYSSISRYRHAAEESNDFPYKEAAQRFYNFLGIVAAKDNREGNGRTAAHINNRVLKYSEKQEIESVNTHKVEMPTIRLTDGNETKTIEFDIGEGAG